MPSLTCFNVNFTPRWLMIILATLSIAILLRLGFWQLQRADEKKKMVAAQALQLTQVPAVWSAIQKQPDQYQKIKIKGTYLKTVFLLDNQHQQHQFGYNVLSPLQIDGGEVVLVDRGWVPAGANRQSIPVIPHPKGAMTLQGSVYFPSFNPWVLGPAFEEKNDKMTVIERVDVDLLAKILQKKVYPFIIRLDKQDANGFVREWAIVSMPPERHLAYALQWFVMALIVLILFVALNLKKTK